VKDKRSLPNKLLLVVYPIMEFLLLIMIGMVGYYFLEHGPQSRLIAVIPFLIYVLYRFISRTRILWSSLMSESDSDAGRQAQLAGEGDESDSTSEDPPASPSSKETGDGAERTAS